MPQRSSSNRNRSRSSDEPLMSQWGQTAKDNPIKTAAVAAGTVAAGVFLWSKRNQISNQISQLSDQITDWTDQMQNGKGRELALTAGPNESSAIESSRATGRRASGSRSRSTTSRSSRSGGKANQTTGGRSQGQNSTF